MRSITAWPRRNRKGFESALSSRRDTGHHGVMTCVFQFSVLIVSAKVWPKYPYFRKDYKRDCSKFIRVIFWLLKAVSKPLDRENSSVWLVICNSRIWSFSSIVGSYCWFSSFHLRSRSFLQTDFTPKGHKSILFFSLLLFCFLSTLKRLNHLYRLFHVY